MKTYIKPAIKCRELHGKQCICAASGVFDGGIMTTSENVDDSQQASGYRGSAWFD